MEALWTLEKKTRKDGGSNPVKWSSQPMSGKQTRSTFCWSSTILIVANRSGPTIVRTIRANSERRLWPTWELLGPSIPGPILALSFQCPECFHLYHCFLAFTSGGTIDMFGVGLGAMGSTDFTKLLSLLSIAQRLERRGQTRKDGGSNPVKWSSQPMSGKQTRSTFCWSSTILIGQKFEVLVWFERISTSSLASASWAFSSHIATYCSRTFVVL